MNPYFVTSSVSFFKCNIARISDEDPVGEELQPVYERIRKREAEWDKETWSKLQPGADAFTGRGATRGRRDCFSSAVVERKRLHARYR